MTPAIVVALAAIAATASETAAVRSCESACCASSCATTFPKCASKCCPFITAADACDSCLTQAGCNPHPPTPIPRHSPAIGTWAELESACQKSGTYTLAKNFKMGSYSNEIDFAGKKLVIWGENATLDAAEKGRLFSALNATLDTSLELHDLVLQNGSDDYVSIEGSVEILDLFSGLSEPALFAPCGRAAEHPTCRAVLFLPPALWCSPSPTLSSKVTQATL